MKWQRCTDCDRQREHTLPIIRLVDDTILFCCKRCWERLEYDKFMDREKAKQELR
jgi:hypothetical protein